MRLWCLALLVLTAGTGLLASTARGDDAQIRLLPPCLAGFPVLPCPTTTAPGPPPPPPLHSPPPVEERRPMVTTPTTVRYDPRRIVVRFRPRTPKGTIDAAFARAGVTPERVLPRLGFHLVRAAEGRRDEALASLRREPSVRGVERETIVDGLDTLPNDPAWPEQWGLHTVGFARAWDVTRGSPSIVVAVLDTGIDRTHSDLDGAVLSGFDFVNLDADATDDHGHGTAVAGIVAARGNNALGLTGACWSCALLPVKVLGADGTGTTAAIAAGVVWAADRGASVINLSLGSPGTTDVLSASVQYATRKNVVVVAAAGNSGSTTPFYPAAESSVVGVAATNQDDRLYSWSNHGAWVRVAAPGCNVAPWPADAYIELCGTSAAAPLVSGLAALLRAANPQATVQQTVDALEKAVVPVPGELRHGRVSAGQAIMQLTPATPPRAAVRVTSRFSGRLTPRTRRALYERRVGPGRIVARLTFDKGRRLSLWLASPNRPVTRMSGKSPLKLVSTTRGGKIRLLVAGRPRRASYRLTVSYVTP
jgi:hypothetical protein